MNPNPKEPTGADCDANALVYQDDNKVGYAIWYPQMGGYVGKAVALLDRQWFEYPHSSEGGCIDVYVWHDGEFPFSKENNPGEAKILHHCDPEQFVQFGETLKALNNARRVEMP